VLNVGIPCVVTSGPAKFKATVRYLGEVLFDSGTFVGVEVSQTSADDENEDPSTADLLWNDGSVNGVRVSFQRFFKGQLKLILGGIQYFELESQKPVSPLLTELQAKADRRASGQSHSGRATPVPPSQPGVTRGLFVRPAQGESNSILVVVQTDAALNNEHAIQYSLSSEVTKRNPTQT